MPLIPIDSLADPRVRPYLDLRNTRLRNRDGKFIAEGDLVVGRLLESGHQVESLVVAEDQMHRVTVPDDLAVYVTPRALIESLIGFKFHRGILACGVRPSPTDLSALVSRPVQATTVVVCAAVHDPENLGGILRNCAAFGVDLVIVSRDSADPFSRRVLRVSMGTLLRLKIHQSAELEHDLSRLHDEFAIHVAASVVDPLAAPLDEAPRPQRLALVLGNERTGLSPAVLAGSQSRWTIPMHLHADSLNVAVASGIFLYHFCQRGSRTHGS
jgi:tRNA G18 (ribose-2'-O)-methylase SpoU